MFDFVRIRTATKLPTRKGTEPCITVYPEFIVTQSDDLMIRGGGFYAVWDEETSFWVKDPGFVVREVDRAIRARSSEYPEDSNVKMLLMEDFSTKKWSEFLSYCNSLPDNFHELDANITFCDEDVKKEDYVTKRLPYPLKSTPTPAYDELMETLYDPDERRKLEWAIGSVITGDSKHIQKFVVLYGTAGSGKSTVLNIIQKLFPGYYSVFEAKSLTSQNDAFALEMFKDNPLVSIQHDGDLSKIEDNTRLNSIVSHEEMVVNEKRKSKYVMNFHTFLFMGTNRPVRITDIKSGVVRRLIDVSPTGNIIPFDRYQKLYSQVDFELSGIAWKCYKTYTSLGEDAYNMYRPTSMMGATNDFYNFVGDHLDIFSREKGITLTEAWTLYKTWCEMYSIKYPLGLRMVKEELKPYFKGYSERKRIDEKFLRNVYFDFDMSKFKEYEGDKHRLPKTAVHSIGLGERASIFDEEFAEQPAQYSKEDGTPKYKWENVKTKLKDLDTSKEHYVKVPDNLIVIDFDIPNDDGEKDANLNEQAAASWPTTYAEYSKSGKGIHLHYIYDGDPAELANEYAPHIEIKVQKGNSSLRRKLTECNNEPIAHISSGLPLKKGGSKVIDFDGLQNEKAIRTIIKKNLRKEIHPGTKPSVDFIFKILNDAYESGMKYDVSDLRPAIMAFANNSTNHSLYCIKLVNQMKFHSEEPSALDDMEWNSDDIFFYDVEVFPNLFVVVWKKQGDSQPVKMINPTPEEIERLVRYKLVGFNCRRYDNHILYARMMGYDNEGLYKLSKDIVVNHGTNSTFREAYGLSYADVYDFSTVKQSLKKFEIELGIHHLENSYPWDDPVPEEAWDEIATYCANDVLATEAVFEHRNADYEARCLLAELSGLRVNDTTRAHATRIIFGTDRNPQKQFNYVDLSKEFPGYVFDNGVSTYKGVVTGEGGYVFAEHGIYENVLTLDVGGMHPASLIQMNMFGDIYTKRFKEIVDARLAIKHRELDKAAKMLDGKLEKYISDESKLDDLSYALKIIVNSVYGLTSARFPCEFKDPRNKDNIVAKRGALFMIDLKEEVEKRGGKVIHIKTDSIKLVDPSDELVQFVYEFGEKYGYSFEVESEYERFCLVNDSVYVAKEKNHGWTATGAQFKVPYVFKTLFSREPIDPIVDMKETMSVDKGVIYLDLVEDPLDGSEHNYKFIGAVGCFTPVVDDSGGGYLYRFCNDKYTFVQGSKGYKWLENEVVAELGLVDKIDESYYKTLCDKAIATIEEFGSFNDFVKE